MLLPPLLYTMHQLIAFLGNPGKKYRITRHNFAWMVCSELENRYPGLQWKSKFRANIAEVSSSGFSQGISPSITGDIRSLLLLPLDFMNNSGKSIQAATAFYGIDIRNTLVLYDDLELPFGTIEFRKEGSLRGHNGLRSIAALTGKKQFPRISLGIGRPERGSVSSHVLGRFSPLEEPQLPTCLDAAAELVMEILKNGVLPTSPRKNVLFTLSQ